MTETRSQVGVVILAAGASSRLGAPKQLIPFEGKSLLRRAAEEGLAAQCGPVVVVVGAGGQQMAAEIEDLPLRIVRNNAWEGGLSTSVRAGLEALEGENVLAAVFAPCDQPALDAALLKRIVTVHRTTGKPIVVSEYGGTWGVPMLFARTLWPELKSLRGDRGAKAVALRSPDEVESIPFPQGAFDIDTPEDYRALLESPAGRQIEVEAV